MIMCGLNLIMMVIGFDHNCNNFDHDGIDDNDAKIK